MRSNWIGQRIKKHPVYIYITIEIINQELEFVIHLLPLLLVSCTKFNGHVAVNKKEIVRDCDEIKPFPGVTGLFKSYKHRPPLLNRTTDEKFAKRKFSRQH